MNLIKDIMIWCFAELMKSAKLFVILKKIYTINIWRNIEMKGSPISEW